MSGWSVREVHGLLVCARCGEEANGCSLTPHDTDLTCGACGGCEWFHIEGERPAVEAAEAGGPYR